MEAIIFDLDGTLWDAVDAVVNCWNIVLREKTTLDMQIEREGALKLFGKTMENIVGIDSFKKSISCTNQQCLSVVLLPWNVIGSVVCLSFKHHLLFARLMLRIQSW